jgi:virulence-associated protein VapD
MARKKKRNSPKITRHIYAEARTILFSRSIQATHIAHKLYNRGERTYREISTMLSKLGYNNRNGRPYSTSSIQQMLKTSIIDTNTGKRVFRFRIWNSTYRMIHGIKNIDREAFQWVRDVNKEYVRIKAFARKRLAAKNLNEK